MCVTSNAKALHLKEMQFQIPCGQTVRSLLMYPMYPTDVAT